MKYCGSRGGATEPPGRNTNRSCWIKRKSCWGIIANRRCGYGQAVLAEAERLLRQAGCPKINLQIRTSNHGVIEFYRKLGYSVDDVASMGKRLEHDDKVT
ncbi:MAG: GNAT family N-acetyltransferase [Verrucomicrobiota bacterium]|nr:GNAT family N-acetyltransferase [Verrucomicrobiota bacterium]